MNRASIIFLLLFVACLPAFSQKKSYQVLKLSETQVNDLMLQAYSQAQLDTLVSCCPEKYTTIKYYYSASFIVEVNPDCKGCRGFDARTFNVMTYEKQRKLNTRTTLNFSKYGYKLTLLAKNEMEHILPMFEQARYNMSER